MWNASGSNIAASGGAITLVPARTTRACFVSYAITVSRGVSRIKSGSMGRKRNAS